MKKRIISLLLAICITAGLFPVLGITANAYSTSHPNTHVNTGDQRADVVAIAESQLGYTENPGTKYGAWWTEATGGSYNFVNEAWCAMFALWCTSQAGCDAAWSGMSALSSSLLSRYQSGKNGCTAYKFGSGYMPRPGDLIFVGTNYSDGSYYTNHVGLVVGVSGNIINTIEGNYNNRVSRSSYDISDGLRSGSTYRGIVYFGVPAYTNDSAGEMTGPVITPEPETPEEFPDTGINYKTTLLSSLNVRQDASISAAVIKALPAGTEVTIVDEKADSTGRMWGRLSTGGWLSLRYTSTGSSTDPAVPGETMIEPYEAKVNCEILLIRVVPGTTAATENQLYYGNSVTIVSVCTVNDMEWGKLSTGGWVATKYLDKVGDDTADDDTNDDDTDEDNTGTGDTNTETVLFTGTVFASTLNVRKEPVTGEVVHILRNGETVEIYETKEVNGKLWGRSSKGWLSLSYVNYTLPDDTETPETPETPSTPDTSTGVACKVTGVLVNVRAGAGTSYGVIKTLPKDTAITITETLMVGTSLWGKLSDGGWISINYTDYRTVVAQQPTTPGTGTTTPDSGTTTPETPSIPATGINCTVTGNVVNVRQGAGTQHPAFTTVKKDAVITIVETKDVNGKLWGKLSTGGWISLAYTNYSSIMGGQTTQPEAPTTPETPAGSVACKVTGNLVNVRAGASSDYAVINSLWNGTEITIVEVSGTGSKAWGKLSTGGWIFLAYTDYATASAGQGTQTTPGTGTTTPGTGTTTPETPSTPDEELPGGVTEVTPDTPDSTTPGTGTGTTTPPAVTTGISGTVNAVSINVRKSAGYSTVVAYLQQGASVMVTETKYADGVLWGHVAEGWVSMSLITTNASASTGITYTITQGVNIRSGVGTSSAITGAAYTGSTVTIVSFAKADNGKTWGQLKDGGWICMDYALS